MEAALEDSSKFAITNKFWIWANEKAVWRRASFRNLEAQLLSEEELKQFGLKLEQITRFRIKVSGLQQDIKVQNQGRYSAPFDLAYVFSTNNNKRSLRAKVQQLDSDK